MELGIVRLKMTHVQSCEQRTDTVKVATYDFKNFIEFSTCNRVAKIAIGHIKSTIKGKGTSKVGLDEKQHSASSDCDATADIRQCNAAHPHIIWPRFYTTSSCITLPVKCDFQQRNIHPDAVPGRYTRCVGIVFQSQVSAVNRRDR